MRFTHFRPPSPPHPAAFSLRRGIMGGMKHRKLRIAWSVAWGVLAVLLCVLWVRSYGRIDTVSGNFRQQQFVHFKSHNGIFTAFTIHSIPGASWKGKVKHAHVLEGQKWAFFAARSRRIISVATPVWPLVVVTLAASTLPWLSSRFSLRTLLIVTTVIALVLGLIVWAYK